MLDWMAAPWIWIPFGAQAALMGVDEWYCHRRRVLNRWERWGHPVDTLAFLAVLLFGIWAPPGPGELEVFLSLAVLSALIVTKDEWEHRRLCSGFENWLHALLFLSHPLLLFWAGWLWWSGASWALKPVAVGTGAFMLYQVVYWNGVRRDQQ